MLGCPNFNWTESLKYQLPPQNADSFWAIIDKRLAIESPNPFM